MRVICEYEIIFLNILVFLIFILGWYFDVYMDKVSLWYNCLKYINKMIVGF